MADESEVSVSESRSEQDAIVPTRSFLMGVSDDPRPVTPSTGSGEPMAALRDKLVDIGFALATRSRLVQADQKWFGENYKGAAVAFQPKDYDEIIAMLDAVAALSRSSGAAPSGETPPPSPELYEQMLKSARWGIVSDPYSAGKELVDLRLEVAALRAAVRGAAPLPTEPSQKTMLADLAEAAQSYLTAQAAVGVTPEQMRALHYRLGCLVGPHLRSYQAAPSEPTEEMTGAEDAARRMFRRSEPEGDRE